MKKKTFDSKVNLAVIISLFFIMVLGCQPEKGKLVALPSEGVEVIKSEIDNDTAQITDDGLVVKVNGKWGDGVLFEVDVKNSSSRELTLKFGEMNLVNGEKESATVGDITDNQANNFTHIRHARINGKENTEKAPDVIINHGESRQFTVIFSQPFNTAKDTEAKRTLYLTIPIEINDKLKTTRKLEVVFEAMK